MISLFIFKSNARGMQYGIGTYFSELTQSLLKKMILKSILSHTKAIIVKSFL